MADYIHRNILSQAYIHVEPDSELTEDDLPELEERLAAFAISRASFFLYPEVVVQIDLEEGSLKSRVTVMGAVFLLMQGVANYPNFREGLGLIHQDSKQLADYIISEAQFLFGAKHEDVIRTEARTGILTSIQKVISQLERIKRAAKEGRSARSIAPQLLEVQNEIDKLMANLATDDDREAVRSGLASVAAGLPTAPPDPKRGSNTPDSVALYAERRRAILGRLKTNQVDR